MRALPAAAALVVVPLLAGCGAFTSGAEETGKPQVVASFYPLQYVAQRIAGQHADVESLASPGTEPHDLELTIQQTAAVADADLLVVSSGFQPAVDDAVDQTAEGQVVDAAEVTELIPVSEDAHAHAEHSDMEHAAEGEPLDPHFWLDPTRLANVAVAVEEQLAELDPDHAEDYAANLDVLTADLDGLDQDIAAGLENCERDTVVVSHNAFGYFAIHYGLHMISVNGISPDAEPSPARLRELAELIEEEQVTTVFSETLASPRMAETLSDELGIDTGVLDPIEGLSDDTAGENYLSLMRKNLAALQKANGCR